MKKLNLVVAISAALTATASLPTIADDSVQFHGFAMAAGDFQSELDRPKNLALHTDITGPNQDPRGKMGDLGNTYWHDYFTALSLNKRFDGVEEGEWADFTFELLGYGDKSVEASQMYVQYGGLDFLPENARVWAGRKYAGERIRNLAYNIREINVDSGIGYNSDNLDVTIGYNQIDWADLNDNQMGLIQAVEGSRVVFDFAYRFGNAEVGANYMQEKDDPIFQQEREAYSAFAKYKFGSFLGLAGNSSAMIQGGKGLIAQYLSTARISGLSEEDDKSMRFSYYGMIHQFEGFTIEPSFVYEYTDRAEQRRATSVPNTQAGGTYEFGNAEEQGLFAALSVHQALTNNISMQYEAVYANKTNRDGVEGVDGSMYKLAMGPSLQLKSVPWAVPVTNISVAYVGGDEEITDLPVESEWRFGYRFEVFF
ncbi:carbohydrate porin [Vibrio ziniensis]|uniref:Carbohydrate porin n=1 Tax=Vibrio ziniensis TaxID=2711221 RepID=A0A6G7CPM1_9VIBR|nr:carbohydrate porin [Vibrio ziniensis]QIH43996.1 carbohydrate porin [Vibrio ziniensis]